MRKIPLVEQIPLAACMALLVGGAVAFFFIAMPMALIEQGAIATGLPTPLGATARALVAGSAALFSGGVTWAAITFAGIASRPRRRPSPRFVIEREAPIYLRGEEYPDLPTRRPIFASEIGVPEMEVAPVSGDAAPPLAPLWCDPVDYDDVPVPADDVLELVDVVIDEEPAAAPAPALAGEPSIATLMARLEAGVERRAAKAAATGQSPAAQIPQTLWDDVGPLRTALDELQRMAVR